MSKHKNPKKTCDFLTPIQAGLTVDKFNTVEECYKAIEFTKMLVQKRRMRKPTGRLVIQKLSTKAVKLLGNEAGK